MEAPCLTPHPDRYAIRPLPAKGRGEVGQPCSPFLVRRVNPAKAPGDPALGRPRIGGSVRGRMKIALLVLLGLLLGTLGGAALGIGAGLAWVEIFKTSNFEGHSGMLVFFGFMPGGAILGGLLGAVIFGVLAVRDAKIPIEPPPRNPSRR